MKLVPLKDNLLVEEDLSSKTTAGGIIIEGTTNDTKTYTVLAVGPEAEGFEGGEQVIIDLQKVKIVKLPGSVKLLALVPVEFVLASLEA